ncbi:MAG: bacillithiol biosynthesis deacetylase BshB1 [Bacteroidota bacterium]
MNLDVLAIGAHPDDVELSCGGTLALLARQGHPVGIVDLSRGELGTRGTKEIRAKEAEEAARILGAEVRVNLELPDGNIQIDAENRNKLIRIIRMYRPKILLIPHWLERHPDHERAHHLSREAWFFAGVAKIHTVDEDGEEQKPYRPPRYFHYMQKYEFHPSFIIDITRVINQRMDAVRAFKSQFFKASTQGPETFLSKPEFLDFLMSRFAYYGSLIGTKYGEPFFSIEPIGLSDPFHIIMGEEG